VDEIVKWMNALVSKGCVRSWGTSNWSPTRRSEAVAAALRLGLALPTADSPQRSLARPLLPLWPDTVTVDEECLQHYQQQAQAGVVYISHIE
jgi:aryl-alcohol dehydrogenase-like predicted oxidoreductase